MNIFWLFFKFGFMAYGGPAMFGFLKKEVIEKRKLIRDVDFMDGLALVQVIPGATLVQMVAYIGYKLNKGIGAFLAFSAFILPAFIEMTVLTIIYKMMGNIELFSQIFKALEAAVIAILLNATILFGKNIIKEWRLIILSIIALLLLILKINILIVIPVVILLTFLLFLIGKRREFFHLSGIEKPKDNKVKQKLNFTELLKEYNAFAFALLLMVAALVISFLLNKNLYITNLSMTKAAFVGFGGGIPMLTIIQYEVVNTLKIIGQKQFVDAIVLGQITPGPILITSSFIGYYISGILGAFLSTIATFYPSFAILAIIAPRFEHIKNNRFVKLAIQGIMGMFVGMLVFFLYSISKDTVKSLTSVIIVAASFIAIRFKVKEIYIIISATVVGLILYLLKIKIL